MHASSKCGRRLRAVEFLLFLHSFRALHGASSSTRRSERRPILIHVVWLLACSCSDLEDVFVCRSCVLSRLSSRFFDCVDSGVRVVECEWHVNRFFDRTEYDEEVIREPDPRDEVSKDRVTTKAGRRCFENDVRRSDTNNPGSKGGVVQRSSESMCESGRARRAQSNHRRRHEGPH